MNICLTLTGKTLDEDIVQFESEKEHTALVELRVDLLAENDPAAIAAFPKRVPVPVLLTYRRKADGGAFDGSDEARAKWFAAFFEIMAKTEGRRIAYVDFEEDFRHDDLTRSAGDLGVRIIRSRHDFTGPVTDIANVCRAMVRGTDEIAKIAFMPRTSADVDRLFAETRDFTDTAHVLCAMGEIGLNSRVFHDLTHSLWTYASVGGLGKIGHLSPGGLYEFRQRNQIQGKKPS